MDFVCVEDYERRAQSMFNNPEELDYFNAAACLGNTARNNIEAYKKYKILPKVLRDVSDIDTTTVIFGESLKFPVGISPTANHILAHDEAELATGKGGIRADTCMIHSLFARKSIEEVTEACQGKGLRWMQIQPIKQKDIIVDVISRAEKNGYKAIVVTCDNPGVPIHYFRLRKPFKNRSVMKLGNFSEEINNYLFNNTDGVTNSLVRFGQDINEPAHSWEWIDWLRSKTSLPIVLKGIMRPDDAIEAIKHDIQGILVSNHGGRMLDDVPATIDVLHEIVQAVDGQVDVFVDGGIRHGTDVFKAIALGAKAVFVGRPIIWGLACNGEDGVYNVLEILRREFHSAMMFSGCAKLTDITNDFVRCM